MKFFILNLWSAFNEKYPYDRQSLLINFYKDWGSIEKNINIYIIKPYSRKENLCESIKTAAINITFEIVMVRNRWLIQ